MVTSLLGGPCSTQEHTHQADRENSGLEMKRDQEQAVPRSKMRESTTREYIHCTG